ncbi:hypothetical protein E1890_16990 [Salmonella enterica subsp. enterica serovar Mountpleasant]|nr:hypothetical protein [Salmonella enterica subsp. enterica serovar Mountpleasant]
MTVIEYLKNNPRSTTQQIAEGTGKAMKSVSGQIANSLCTGAIIREKGKGGLMVYRVNDMPFGCGNSLTMMFNELLRGARQ